MKLKILKKLIAVFCTATLLGTATVPYVGALKSTNLYYSKSKDLARVITDRINLSLDSIKIIRKNISKTNKDLFEKTNAIFEGLCEVLNNINDIEVVDEPKVLETIDNCTNNVSEEIRKVFSYLQIPSVLENENSETMGNINLYMQKLEELRNSLNEFYKDTVAIINEFMNNKQTDEKFDPGKEVLTKKFKEITKTFSEANREKELNLRLLDSYYRNFNIDFEEEYNTIRSEWKFLKSDVDYLKLCFEDFCKKCENDSFSLRRSERLDLYVCKEKINPDLYKIPLKIKNLKFITNSKFFKLITGSFNKDGSIFEYSNYLKKCSERYPHELYAYEFLRPECGTKRLISEINYILKNNKLEKQLNNQTETKSKLNNLIKNMQFVMAPIEKYANEIKERENDRQTVSKLDKEHLYSLNIVLEDIKIYLQELEELKKPKKFLDIEKISNLKISEFAKNEYLFDVFPEIVQKLNNLIEEIKYINGNEENISFNEQAQKKLDDDIKKSQIKFLNASSEFNSCIEFLNSRYPNNYLVKQIQQIIYPGFEDIHLSIEELKNEKDKYDKLIKADNKIPIKYCFKSELQNKISEIDIKMKYCQYVSNFLILKVFEDNGEIVDFQEKIDGRSDGRSYTNVGSYLKEFCAYNYICDLKKSKIFKSITTMRDEIEDIEKNLLVYEGELGKNFGEKNNIYIQEMKAINLLKTKIETCGNNINSLICDINSNGKNITQINKFNFKYVKNLDDKIKNFKSQFGDQKKRMEICNKIFLENTKLNTQQMDNIYNATYYLYYINLYLNDVVKHIENLIESYKQNQNLSQNNYQNLYNSILRVTRSYQYRLNEAMHSIKESQFRINSNISELGNNNKVEKIKEIYDDIQKQKNSLRESQNLSIEDIVGEIRSYFEYIDLLKTDLSKISNRLK